MKILENGFDEAVAVLALSKRYRKWLRTTNGLERLNEEIRRRERVITIIPNRVSALRLIGALLLEIRYRMVGGKAVGVTDRLIPVSSNRYLNFATYHFADLLLHTN